MTQEEKAKAYDEAIKRAKSLIGDTIIEESGQHIAEVIFPELKESEDEKIRKAIHIYLDWLDGRFEYQPKGDYTIKDMLAWLEKQNSNVDNSNKEYWRGYREGKQEILDKYAELEKQGEQKASYTTIAETGNGGINALVTRELPANGCDEQKSIIEMKSPEESLGISSKEYNDIVNDCIYGEQKPAASYCQEHCKGYQETGKCFADGDCKDKREAKQNPAWSEEDDDDACMNDIISKVENNLQLNKAEIDWLKSLKQRNTWKPSDEQLETLKDAIHIKPLENPSDNPLWTLYEQLKKLLEE